MICLIFGRILDKTRSGPIQREKRQLVISTFSTIQGLVCMDDSKADMTTGSFRSKASCSTFVLLFGVVLCIFTLELVARKF